MSSSRWSASEIEFATNLYMAGTSLLEISKALSDKFGTQRTYDAVARQVKVKGLPALRRVTEKSSVFDGNAMARKVLAAGDQGAASVVNVNLDEVTMRENLSQMGYKIEKLTPDKMDREFDIDPGLFIGDMYQFGVLSCTHLGSKFQQLTYLKAFYRLLEDRGIKVAFHCGDLVDGMQVYKGQEFELFLHGLDAQVNYAIEHYPTLAGGKTYIIDGNHDYDFVARAGADPLVKVAQARPDIEYLGAYGAYPKIDQLKIYLQHGGKGNAYARSYRLQKNIEQFAPAAKPDIYFLGHFHTGVFLPEYRNVVSAQVPCFQSQTPFERRHGLYPEIAGLIVEVIINDVHRQNGLVNVKMEWVPFYVPKINDY